MARNSLGVGRAMSHLVRSLIGRQRRRPHLPEPIAWHDLERLEPRVLLAAGVCDLSFQAAQANMALAAAVTPAVSVTASARGRASETDPTGRGEGHFVVTRSGGNLLEPLEVHCAMSGTATADDDYTGPADLIVIPAGMKSVKIDLVPIDDALTEGPETAILTLTPDAAYGINTRKAAAGITIADNEPYLDLVVSSAKVSPKSVKSGDTTRTIKLSATLANRGNTVLSGALVHLSMIDVANPDNLIDLGDASLIKPLAAGKRTTLKRTILFGELATAPAVGVYQIKAVAEAAPSSPPEINPLDNTLLAASATLTVLNPAPVTMQLRRIGVNDSPDMIGGQAATFLVPTGWKLDGRVTWRLHPTAPASLSVRIYNPGGLEAAEVFPPGQFAWADYLPSYGFPVGSLYLGNEVLQPPVDVLTCLKEIVLPRLRPDVGAQVVLEEETPGYATAVRAEYPPDGPTSTTTVTAGRIRIEYQLDGQAVEEDFYCALSQMYMPTVNMTYWGVDHVLAVRAAKGQLNDKAAVLTLLGQSAHVNLAWYNKYTQLLQKIFDAKMQDIANQGVLSQIISQTSNEISDMVRSAYENHEAMEDHIGQSFTEYIRDEGEYYDPYDQQTVVLPSGYDRVWANGSDEYVFSQDLNFKPGGGNWHLLELQ